MYLEDGREIYESDKYPGYYIDADTGAFCDEMGNYIGGNIDNGDTPGRKPTMRREHRNNYLNKEAMKILYRILMLLLWIPIVAFLIFGLPIILIISSVVYLFTGRTKGLFFEMYINVFEELIDTASILAKKGEKE